MIAWWMAGCLPGQLTELERDALDQFTLDDLVPSPNPFVDDKAVITLGRVLYVDETLSVGDPVSCQTCHELCLEPKEDADDPDVLCEAPLEGNPSGVDPRRTSTSMGALGEPTARNAPTVIATAHRDRWGWPARFCDLEEQILFPLTSNGAYGIAKDELGTVLVRAASDHPREWRAAFGELPELGDTATRQFSWALEAFLRTLEPAPSPLDRYLDHDEGALGAEELHGASLFLGKGHCVECHSGPLLSDGQLHNIGVPGGDLGRGDPTIDEVCGPRDPEQSAGRFQTPSLRGVASTSPYLHDGSLRTLDEVLWHYDEGGADEDFVGEKDPNVKPLFLSDDELDDLAAFLRALGPS